MSYRVFISYKHTPVGGKGVTRDYYIAADLHKTLKDAGIETFFSEKDLSSSDFTYEINTALEQAEIMILVGTDPEYINSKWVRLEWSSFLAAINNGRKPDGGIYTYMEGMTVNDLPMVLGKFQSYTTAEKDALVKRIKKELHIQEGSVPVLLQPVPKPVKPPYTQPQPVQPNRQPQPVTVSQPQRVVINKPVTPIYKDSEPKPANHSANPVTVKRTPLIVTIAVVLVVAIVGSIWGASALSGNSTSSVKSLSELDSISKGDHFTFGNYPQGENGEEEPIEWRVLAVDGDKALVISEKLLDCVEYNEEYTNVTWETCTLRSWMNHDFLYAAFSNGEQAKIATVTNQNPDNPEYGTEGGNATQDRIFALSIEEANQYFSNVNDRSREGTCWWWLRSPGYGGNYAADVDGTGDIGQFGSNVDNFNVAVRPAFWLNLS